MNEISLGNQSSQTARACALSVWEPQQKYSIITGSLPQVHSSLLIEPQAGTPTYQDPLRFPLTAIAGLVAKSRDGGKIIDLIVRESNPGFAARLGSTPESLRGTLLFQKMIDPLPEAIKKDVLQALGNGDTHWKGEFRDTSVSDERWYQLEVARLGDTSPLVSLHLTDITEEVLLKKELELYKKLARTDNLTGLLNRNGFNEQIAAEVSRSLRDASPVSLIMIDIDHFKAVNDTWGHDVGDQTLQRVAAIIEDAIREYDTAARVGGEEFVILLPKTDQETAALVAERIRASIEAYSQVSVGEESFSVTASLGVVEMNLPRHPQHSDISHVIDVVKTEAYRDADVALYDSKHGGRNRVTVAHSQGKHRTVEHS
ncbi:MAG: diguanylate cyclase [Bdellovibrionales bacterium]|nr:diguanylate cyclase [Bdellovibrionales bacterium]